MAETLSKVFIDVEVDAAVAGDAELARKLEEVCPVDIFAATDAGVSIVEKNLDECVLCNLCVDAAPEGSVRVVKLYEVAAASSRASPRRRSGRLHHRPQPLHRSAISLDLHVRALGRLVADDEEGDQRARVAGQAEIGAGHLAAGGDDPAAGDAQVEGVAAAAQLHGHLDLRRRLQDDPQRVGQPGRFDLVDFVHAEEVEAPAGELEDRALEAAAELGQLVDDAGGRGFELAAADDPFRLEVAQPLGQHVGRGSADGAVEFGEAQRPEQQLAHDQQRPALPDPVEGAGEAARLAVVATCHSVEFYQLNWKFKVAAWKSGTVSAHRCSHVPPGPRVEPTMNRIADLTWKRPKQVLAVVGAFALLAVCFGHDVEQHLKAAGFTDPSSESEEATRVLRESLGYDPNPAIVLAVRAPGGGKLDLTDPTVRGEVDRLASGMAKVQYVGHVVNPLREPHAGAALIAKDGKSLVIAGDLSTNDVEDAGGIAAERVKRLADASPLDVAEGGFAQGFNETNDQTREDLTKAELIAFPVLALLLLFVFRGVVAASSHF